MAHRITAVIFDLDGVLCSTDRYHYQAWKALADRLGIAFDETANDRLRGISRMASLDIVLGNRAGEFSQEGKLALAEEKNETYRKLLAQMTPADLAPETRTTLQVLRERGFLLAVGSSSKNTRFILERIGLAGFFDAVADGTDITRSKPDPEVFLVAARKLGIAPADCAVVEDAKAGIEAAKAAGMMAIAFGGDAAGCGKEDCVLTTFGSLPDML